MHTAKDIELTLSAANLGIAQAARERLQGHTEPAAWDVDGEPFARAYSHLTAEGFSRMDARDHANAFVIGYRNAFPTP